MINQIPTIAIAAQNMASNPDMNIWVAANAGSGKTHVLTERVLRLLLTGVKPARILCLTYTKAAAAVMQERIFNRLSLWVNLSEEQLKQKLFALTGNHPSQKDIIKARQLFAKALETPGGLRIQTIHSFCEGILRQFPLEAQLFPAFKVDENKINIIFEQCYQELFIDVKNDKNSIEADLLINSFRKLGGYNFKKFLREIVKKEEVILNLHQELENSFYLELFNLLQDLTKDDLYIKIKNDFSSISWRNILQALSYGGKRAANFIAQLDECWKLPADCWSEKLISIFCVKADSKHIELKQFNIIATQATRNELPDIVELMELKAKQLLIWLEQIAILDLIEDNIQLFKVAKYFLGKYNRLKNQSSILDYDDLISKTLALLKSCDVAWIHYKLDKGIEHILVDEAQDTGKQQWEIIQLLTSEFFAGEGQIIKNRTIFAVGDEKQSIYSFRGADPQEFANNYRYFKNKAKAANLSFEQVKLNFSFRSSPAVIEAVDKVFSKPNNYRGLSVDKQPTTHDFIRKNIVGEVELWDYVIVEKVKNDFTNWDMDKASVTTAVSKLANKIAKTISGWLTEKQILLEKNRPIKPSDILILVKNRTNILPLLIKSFNNYNIPTTGEDTLKLLDHIAIQDLIALGKFLLQPADDLSLAAVLKSPIFNLTEQQLFDLAHNRDKNSSLFYAIKKYAKDDQKIADILMELEIFLALVDNITPFEFYNRILAQYEVRKRFVARLGEGVNEILNIFLDKLLDCENNKINSLELLIDNLTEANPTIKRDLEQTLDQVRIMTVHGSKGLEAPIVFLIDPGKIESNPAKSSTNLYVFDRNAQDDKKLHLFLNKDNKNLSVFKEICNKELQQKEDEYCRLLYVAMTRAEDRLIICGFKGEKNTKDNLWLDRVKAVFNAEELESYLDEDKLWRWKYKKNASNLLLVNEQKTETIVNYPEIPDIFRKTLPVEKNLTYHIQPSNILVKDDQEKYQSPLLTIPSEKSVFLLERGIIIHKLLQYLPMIDKNKHEEAAKNYIKNYAINWSQTQQQSIITSVLKLLNDPEYNYIFSKNSKAEVPIRGELLINGSKKQISGLIDRIIIEDNNLLLIDYKTSFCPSTIEDIPIAHIAQLALYEKIVQPLYPDKKIDVILIYTQVPKSYNITENLRNNAYNEIVKTIT
ncbi:double-strand break repair helicase AddA [Bartonella sp. DGB1]|uniref:double-strand break repair helicase AddA n=1 Tax=Bartonella sp. DGB1 TaxID=3239807 RepID=UPI003524447F